MDVLRSIQGLHGKFFSEQAVSEEWTATLLEVMQQIIKRGMARRILLNADTLPVLTIWSILACERNVALFLLSNEKDITSDMMDLWGFRKEIDALLLKKADLAKYRSTLHTTHSYKIDPPDILDALLKEAQREASELKHNWLDVEHLLLATVQMPNNDLREIFHRHNLDYLSLKAKLVELLQKLSNPGPTSGEKASPHPGSP